MPDITNIDGQLEKIVDLTGQLATGLPGTYLPTAGGTMTGPIEGNPLTFKADDGSGNSSELILNPNKSITWGGVSLTDGGLITIRTVSLTVPSSGAAVNIGAAVAPDVDGYKFVCWVNATSSGAVFPVAISNASGVSSAVWGIDTVEGKTVNCTALYVRKWN